MSFMVSAISALSLSRSPSSLACATCVMKLLKAALGIYLTTV